MKQQHISTYLKNARSRAKRDNVPFSLTKEYLLSIATDECPVFHTPFEWGVSGLGKGHMKDNCPTLDRILPELGYVEGNVAFISHRANRLKDNGTMQEHYDIADWIWSHTHAKENTTTPVPTGSDNQGEVYPELGPFSTTGFGKNGDYLDYHSRTIPGQDADYSTQTSSGDSMGHRDQEVGTFVTSYDIQNNGYPCAKVIWIADRSGYIPNKP